MLTVETPCILLPLFIHCKVYYCIISIADSSLWHSFQGHMYMLDDRKRDFTFSKVMLTKIVFNEEIQCSNTTWILRFREKYFEIPFNNYLYRDSVYSHLVYKHRFSIDVGKVKRKTDDQLNNVLALL